MNKNGKKDFDKWMKVKKQINKENKIRSIKVVGMLLLGLMTKLKLLSSLRFRL